MKGQMMQTLTVKREARKMIQNLPDDCTYEDIQYHLYVVEKVRKSIERAERGEVSSHEEARRRVSKWLSD
jgi:hypothetical protein